MEYPRDWVCIQKRTFPYFSVLLGNYLALFRRNVSTKTPYVYPEIISKDILGGAGCSLKMCCQK